MIASAAGDPLPSPLTRLLPLLPQRAVTHGSGGYINAGIPAGTDAEGKALQNPHVALAAQ
jgi:hypothetical protein